MVSKTTPPSATVGQEDHLPMSVLRWIARLAALMITGGYLLLLIGETGHHSWTGILLLTTSCLGMLLAWRWEVPGAILSLAALVAFTLLERMGHHAVLLVLATPGILFLVDGAVRRGGRANT